MKSSHAILAAGTMIAVGIAAAPQGFSRSQDDQAETEAAPKVRILTPEEVRERNDEWEANAEKSKALLEEYLQFEAPPGGEPVDLAKAREAIDKLQEAASLGNAEAQFEMAKLIIASDGKFGTEEDVIAFSMAAALQGDREAQNIIGVGHERGIGGTRDLEKAEHWFRLSAEQEFPSSQLHLAEILLELGEGNSEAEKEAMNWFRRSAGNDWVTAKYRLAGILRNPELLETDFDESLRWYREAIADGHSQSKTDLALLYIWGEPFGDNFDVGYRMLKELSEEGYGPARANIGMLILQGQFGIPPDRMQAYAWHLFALSGEVPTYARPTMENNLRSTEVQLTAEQVEQAKSLTTGQGPTFPERE